MDPYRRDRRIGRWVLPRDTFDYGNYEGAKAVQDSVLVLRAMPDFATDSIEFIGICPQFDPVPEGETVPSYRADITAHGVLWVRTPT